jgi:hypothetical protein
MKKVFLIAAIAFSTHGFAQQANVKLNLPKGQKLEMVTEMKKSTTLEVMGQSMESSVTSTMTEMFDVEDAGPSGATVEHKVKRLVFNTEGGMGGNQSFDSEKESDMKGQIGKMLEKSIKNKYTMKLDAKGNVTEVKVDDDNPNAKKNSQEEQIAQMVSSQLGLALGIPKVGEASIFRILPGRELKAGESWTDSSSSNGISKTTIYKVNAISDTEVTLDFTEQVVTKVTQQMMGQEATINNTDKSTGKVIIDKNTGVLKQRTSTVDSKGTIDAQGMTIPVAGKTTLTISMK